MNFLSWQSIAWAAGLTVPPLVALYFLKLKRAARVVPSTLLWRKSIEDLHVNSPFQRLRSSLLLLLQLLVLLLGAVALGQPLWEQSKAYEDTLILLIDHSASMGALEAGGQTRLELAKEQARRVIDNMGDDSRAMVIAFCDRATVVSSFDSNKAALRRKIDSIEPTQSTTTLTEAISLAEAYTQNIVIGGEVAGSDKSPDKPAPNASIFVFTDGRIADAGKVVLQRFDVDRITMTTVGERKDNVGITAMDARRNYESPQWLDVAATMQNFGPSEVSCDAVLYVDGKNVDIATVSLAPGIVEGEAPKSATSAAAPGSIAVVAFDSVDFATGGVVEVVLRVDDALRTDDRAWTVVDPPRHVRVLLVGPGNPFLEGALSTLNIDLEVWTPAQYESAADKLISDGDRSAFDVVMFDRCASAKLPRGNYMYWGAVPPIAGLATGRVIDNEVIFNWDDTHPVLRHVAVAGLYVNQWLELKLPPEAVSIVDGQTGPVLAYLARDGSQFVISAFSLIVANDSGGEFMNTDWVVQVDFVVFVQNLVEFLASNVAMRSARSLHLGEPISAPTSRKTETATMVRPGGSRENVPTGGVQTIHYARTRDVGVYRIEPGVVGEDTFAVNLFDDVESRIAPSKQLELGATQVTAEATEVPLNKHAWPYVLLVMLGIILLEWLVYSRRVFV